MAFKYEATVQHGEDKTEYVNLVVELHLGIVGEVAGLVHADTADAEVLGVTEGLVQRIGDEPVRDEVLGDGSDRGDYVMLFFVRHVLAETFYGSAIVSGGRVPFHRPHGPDKIVGGGLLLFCCDKAKWSRP